MYYFLHATSYGTEQTHTSTEAFAGCVPLHHPLILGPLGSCALLYITASVLIPYVLSEPVSLRLMWRIW